MTIHAGILDDATTIDPDHSAKVRALIHATEPDADMHPDQYSEPERWPDGGLVLEDDDPQPEDYMP